MGPRRAIPIAWLGIFLVGCSDSPSSTPNVDASTPVGDLDAQAQACGYAASFGESRISGTTPYGNMNLEFERSWFANGCGPMSMSISYLPIEDSGYRFVVKFAVPALEFLEGKAFSQPGTFPVSLKTSVCNLDGENCIFHDTEGSADIRILVDDERMNPNTNIGLSFSGDGWELSTAELSGHSCSWTWNPC